ncbi:MAG: hypothetical protein ABJB40_11595, partial [Acidobacteriota bacterium]
MQTQRTLDEFRNEPFTDYSKPENAEAMRAAIEKVRGELGREYPIVINGEKIVLESKFSSINPAKTSEVVGVFSEGDTNTDLVEKAITAATNAFKKWRNVPAVELTARLSHPTLYQFLRDADARLPRAEIFYGLALP